MTGVGRALNPLQWWPELALILVYWLVRFHHLTAFPVFDDEAIHIRQAKMVWRFLPFSGADDGRVLNILLYAPFWPFGAGALWVSRAAYLILGVIGFAGLMKLGETIFRRSAGRWAGLIFTLLPYAFFFERLALADTVGIPLLTLLALSSVLLTGRRSQSIVLLGGMALGGVILAKLSNLVFLYVPLWAFVLFGLRATWKRSLGQVLALYLCGILAIMPIVLFLVFRAHSTLGFANVATRTTPVPLAERLAHQTSTLSTYLGPYLTWPILGLCLVALGVALWQRQAGVWYAFGIVALPGTALIVGANSVESRYLLPILPGVALLAGYGADRIATNARIPSRFASVALIGLIGLGGPLRFLWNGWMAPEELRLPPSDRGSYIQDWPSGFGMEAAGQLILDRAVRGPLVVVVTEGWHIPGLTVHFGWERNLRGVYYFSEPRLQMFWLTSGCDPFALTGQLNAPVLLVTERYRYAATLECLNADKTLVDSYPKPGGRNIIEVYELRPRQP